MAKSKQKMVHCRYTKCNLLHESTELAKDDAVKGDGKAVTYYHPDCYHIMQTVNKIKDLFVKQINPAMTGSQIAQLISIVNNLIFKKNFDVDYILFALQYFIKNKPGALKYPGGMSYIVQSRDVESAWKKEQDKLLRVDIRKQQQQQEEVITKDEFVDFDLPTNDTFVNHFNNKSRFSNVLGV